MSVWKMVVLAGGMALILTSCGGSSGSGGDNSCKPTGGASGATATQTVKINPDQNTVGRYDPSTVQVKVGDSVEWDWIDTSINHSVTSDDSGLFDSCLQNAGAKFTVTFTKAGDVKYHCTIHAQMTGEVKVT